MSTQLRWENGSVILLKTQLSDLEYLRPLRKEAMKLHCSGRITSELISWQLEAVGMDAGVLSTVKLKNKQSGKYMRVAKTEESKSEDASGECHVDCNGTGDDDSCVFTLVKKPTAHAYVRFRSAFAAGKYICVDADTGYVHATADESLTGCLFKAEPVTASFDSGVEEESQDWGFLLKKTPSKLKSQREADIPELNWRTGDMVVLKAKSGYLRSTPMNETRICGLGGSKGRYSTWILKVKEKEPRILVQFQNSQSEKYMRILEQSTTDASAADSDSVSKKKKKKYSVDICGDEEDAGSVFVLCIEKGIGSVSMYSKTTTLYSAMTTEPLYILPTADGNVTTTFDGSDPLIRLQARVFQHKSKKTLWTAKTTLEATLVEKMAVKETRAKYMQSKGKSVQTEEMRCKAFERMVAAAPAERREVDSVVASVRGEYKRKNTKSELILQRVWVLLKVGRVEEALEVLITFEGKYQINDAVPGASDKLPLWALMPSRLDFETALAVLPVWRYILKEFDVSKLKFKDYFNGRIMTPISIAAAHDLDDYVRAVIAEEELQGTVKEQISFAENCEVLQHNCILLIDAMKRVAEESERKNALELELFEEIRQSLAEERTALVAEGRAAVGKVLDDATIEKIAKAMASKMAAKRSKMTVSSAFDLLRDALIVLIKEKRCVLDEVWNLCWEWQKLSGEKSLWLTVKQKIKDVLSFPQLHSKPSEWHWYLENWANNPVMAELSVVGEEIDSSLSPLPSMAADSRSIVKSTSMATLSRGVSSGDLRRTKYDDVCDFCDAQLEKQKRCIEKEMDTIISADMESWKKTLDFSYVNRKYPDASKWRQDCVPLGVTASVKETDLFDISLFTSSLDFDAAQSYDLDSYMTDVLTNAHWCNPSFQKFMKEAYGGVCLVHSGPVKNIERCRVKAQLDYGSSKFPTSARIIDVIRCSATFDDLHSFYESLNEFSNIGFLDRISSVSRRTALQKALDKLDLKIQIMRCKNGFSRKKLALDVHYEKTCDGLPVPCVYGDVKFNVVVTSKSRKRAIVGEVQFLLKAMLKAKLAAHEFYEVTRRRAFFHAVRSHLPLFPRNLRIAGATQRQLSRLIVRQPLWFSNDVFLNTDDDFESRNLLMRLLASGLNKDLALALLNLPQGVPSDVWSQRSESDMTLLKYVLVLRDTELMKLFLAQVPRATEKQIWLYGRGSPLRFAFEIRKQLVPELVEAIPASLPISEVWHNVDVFYAVIRNRYDHLGQRLRVFIENSSEEWYGATLRKPLPSRLARRMETPLMAAMRFHAVSDDALKYLVPVFEESEKEEMLKYWTYTTDDGWTVFNYALTESGAVGVEKLKSVVPAEAVAGLHESAVAQSDKRKRDTERLQQFLHKSKKWKKHTTAAGKGWKGVKKTVVKPAPAKKKAALAAAKPRPALVRESSKAALETSDLLMSAMSASYGGKKVVAKSKVLGGHKVTKTGERWVRPKAK